MTPLQRLQEMLDEAAASTNATRDLDPRLHGYQRRAVEHLHANPRAGLFLEMGLGKTATVLQALTLEHLPALVIAPKRVAEHVWGPERDKWRPDLSIAVAAGSPKKRALESGADVTVIGRDNIRDVTPGRFRTVVLDELSGFKARGTQRWKHARKITDAAAYVWGLTGTPAPNGHMDLWAQLFLLDRGERLETTLTKFRSRYYDVGRQLPTGVIIEWNLKQGAKERIEDRISDICLSMKNADYLDLPPVTVNTVEVGLPTKAKRVYSDLLRTLVADLTADAGQVHTAANAAVLTGKLSQVTAGFLYADGDTSVVQPLHDEKVRAVAEIVEGTGSPVLVFYRFRAEAEALREALPQARMIDEPGVIEQWNAGEVPVLLAHPASAGHGLNLQAGGHTVVWSTLPWSAELYEQGNARVARQGQEHPVVVHHVVVLESVDTRIVSVLAGKIGVQDALMAVLAEP